MAHAVALVAVLAVAASCTYGGTVGDPGALEVGDTRLLVSELNDELDFFVANPAAAQSLLGTDVSGIATGADDADAQRRQLAVGVLNVHAYAALLGEAAAARGVVPSAEDEAEAARTIASLGGSAVPPPDSLVSVIEGLVANQLALAAAIDAESAPISDDDVRAAYTEAVADATRFERYTCSSHILIRFPGAGSGAAAAAPTAEQEAAALAAAGQAVARLDAGEDFAAVATDLSEDPGSAARGGDLGCNFGGTFVPEFESALAELQPGERSAPVRTQFGYHVIRLDARGVPPLEKVEAEIRAELESRRGDSRDQLVALVTEAASTVDVVVNPRYGVWDPGRVAVVAPPGSAPAPTTVQSAPGAIDLGGLEVGDLPGG